MRKNFLKSQWSMFSGAAIEMLQNKNVCIARALVASTTLAELDQLVVTRRHCLT